MTWGGGGGRGISLYDVSFLKDLDKGAACGHVCFFQKNNESAVISHEFSFPVFFPFDENAFILIP